MARPWTPRPLSAAFLQSRREWLKARPFPHFLAGNASAPTYGAELDLDHARDYIAHMFEQFAAGSPHFRFADRIKQDLAELRTIDEALQHAGVPGATVLREYIAATEALLRSFAVEYEAWCTAHAAEAHDRAPAV